MRKVVITGAANGVGKAVAKLLKNEDLILIDIDEVNLKNLSNELNANYYVCDVTDEKRVEEVIKDSENKFEKIDCLINCAAMWISGDMSKLQQPIFDNMNTYERIKKVIDTNVFGTIAMIKGIFPIMQKQGKGQIINMNSQS